MLFKKDDLTSVSVQFFRPKYLNLKFVCPRRQGCVSFPVCHTLLFPFCWTDPHRKILGQVELNKTAWQGKYQAWFFPHRDTLWPSHSAHLKASVVWKKQSISRVMSSLKRTHVFVRRATQRINPTPSSENALPSSHMHPCPETWKGEENRDVIALFAPLPRSLCACAVKVVDST